MSKKLFGCICALFLAVTAHADADRDPYLEEPVQLQVENNVNTTLNVEIFNNQPAFSSLNMNHQPHTNYFQDNGRPTPPYGSLVPVVITGNVRVASRTWTVLTDLMQYVQYELSKQGYNTNLGYYSVQSVRVTARAISNGSQVAIADSHNILSSMIVPHFNNNGVILYNAVGNMNALNWPLNLLFQGQVDVQNITLFLSPNVNHSPSPGWGHPHPYPPHQQFLQLGKTFTFDKRPVSGRSQTAIFRNVNLVTRGSIPYPGYRQIVIDVVGNSFMSTKVKVEYINRYGYKDSIDLTTRRTQVRDGDHQIFDIPHGVAVQAVIIEGYSPNIKGSRARVSVGLR